jgi:hypothetical protein
VGYRVETQVRSVQVLGPTQVIQVQQAGIRTSPSGVYVEYPVPLPLWDGFDSPEVLAPLADGIEGVIAQGLCVGGSYAQDYDKNGLLVDYFEALVEYVPPGPLGIPQSTTVLIPCAAFIGLEGDPFLVRLGESPQSLLTAAYDKLVAAANAGG